MVANVSAFVDQSGSLRKLPDLINSQWVVRNDGDTCCCGQEIGPLFAPCRTGAAWVYATIKPGVILKFAGWAGFDRDEPVAGFVSDRLPGLVVYLSLASLWKWCVKDGPGCSGTVTVRIVGDECCDEGEGE